MWSRSEAGGCGKKNATSTVGRVRRGCLGSSRRRGRMGIRTFNWSILRRADGDVGVPRINGVGWILCEARGGVVCPVFHGSF